MCSYHDIEFGSVAEILTVCSIKEVPQDGTLPESLNDPSPSIHTPSSESNVQISIPPSSETKVMITTPTSSDAEVKFATQISSGTQGKVTTPTSSETEVKYASTTSSEAGLKFTASMSSDTKEHFIPRTSSEIEVEFNNTTSAERKGKSLKQNVQYGSNDIRYEKTKIKKSKEQPFSQTEVIKKKV